LLEGLDHREPRSVDDLVNLSAGLNANTVKAFLKELLSFGLIAAVEDDR
jgi:hypothetical protein